MPSGLSFETKCIRKTTTDRFSQDASLNHVHDLSGFDSEDELDPLPDPPLNQIPPEYINPAIEEELLEFKREINKRF